jgi:predicted MFS family arabinose efflux permease
VGLALAVGGIAGILAQAPAGALLDRVHPKRALIALAPAFWPVMLSQILIGGTSSVFIPALCAVSLGIVGRRLFDARQGRNQAFNSAGNIVAALSMGALGYLISDRSIFFFVMVAALPTFVALLLIRPDEIDYDRARGEGR